MNVTVERVKHELDRSFVIARGSTRTAAAVRLTLEAGGRLGRGEAHPSEAVTGETPDTVVEWVEGVRDRLEGADLDAWDRVVDDLPGARENPAARAAVSLAVHDLAGRLRGEPAHQLLGLAAGELPTSATVSLDDPATMAREAEGWAERGFHHLKLKLGEAGRDLERVEAVREAVPEATIRVDANGGWTRPEARTLLPELADRDVALVEQPVSADDLRALVAVAEVSPVPVYADEPVATADDVDALADAGFVGGVNVKIMKSGGLRPALATIRRAREADLGVQVGCMVEAGIGIAGAAQLHSVADWADLDGHVLLADDPYDGPAVEDGRIATPDGPGLGVALEDDRP